MFGFGREAQGLNQKSWEQRAAGLVFLYQTLGPQGRAALGGIAMAIAAAPWGLWPLAWIAAHPLWQLALSPQVSRGQGLRGTIFWGLGYHGLILAWLWGLHPLTWLGISWGASVAIALGCWALVTLWGTLQGVLWWGLMRWFTQTGFTQTAARRSRGLGSIVVLGTALGCGLDWLWSYSPLYWDPWAFTQSPHNPWILHLGQLSGPQTITAALWGVNGLLALARSPRDLGRILGLLLSLHLLGASLMATALPDPPDQTLRMGVIQGNIPTRQKLTPAGLELAQTRYSQSYETLANQGVQAVLLPEGAFPWFWGDGLNREGVFLEAIARHRLPAWVGTFVMDTSGTDARGTDARGIHAPPPTPSSYTQSLIGISSPSGTWTSRYNKVRLVPLGEYIPLQPWLGRFLGRLSSLSATMEAGLPNQQFQTPWGRAAVGICYEPAFARLFQPQIAAGAEFILTSSNLDPYGRVLMAQHEAHDVMRAIESDRWLLRATNTGYSGAISPRGQVQRLANNRVIAAPFTLYRRSHQTLYTRWGDWFTPCLGAIAILQMLYRRTKPRIYQP